MKKVFILLFAITIVFSAKSQEDSSSVKTVLGTVDDYGGFMSPVVKFGKINQDQAFMIGCHGGLMLNHKLTIGNAIYVQSSNSYFDGQDYNGVDTTLSVHMSYGGLFVRYDLMYKFPVHLSVPVALGFGNTTVKYKRADWYGLETEEDWENQLMPHFVESSTFLFIEPGLNAEINLTRYIQLSLGVSYRVVYNSDLNSLTDEDLSGPMVNWSINFGNF
jgi:hypothetical protein